MSHESIRRAGPEDAPAVARLLHQFNTEFDEFSPGVEVLTERARHLIAYRQLIFLLAGEGPDGLAQLSLRPSIWSGELDALLEELYVVPESRGHGLGRALLDAAMEAAREAGATRIELNTSTDDTAARGLYESLGFTNREGAPEGPQMLYYEREL
jgi:ribosomal protein S18 acetylase RimI-like enzyme